MFLTGQVFLSSVWGPNQTEYPLSKLFFLSLNPVRMALLSHWPLQQPVFISFCYIILANIYWCIWLLFEIMWSHIYLPIRTILNTNYVLNIWNWMSEWRIYNFLHDLIWVSGVKWAKLWKTARLAKITRYCYIQLLEGEICGVFGNTRVSREIFCIRKERSPVQHNSASSVGSNF